MGYHHPRAPFLFEEVVAYHGTSVEAARSIVDSQQMLVSDRPHEWLGRGAYFFQSSVHRARQWAKQRYGDEAAVVSARLRLGHCIDLLDNRWVPPMQLIEGDLAERSGAEAPRNKGKRHMLDYAVIEELANEWRPDTIRAAFQESTEEPVAPGALFQDATHIQIAVRDPTASIIELRYDRGCL